MTTLKNLKGTAIQFLDEDPVVYIGAWASGGSMNTGRDSLAGTGIQTSALAVGGSPGDKGETEYYNGSSWTELGDLNTSRRGLAA